MKVKPRLAIICSHPVQYYAPVFKLLAQSVEIKVFYTAGKHAMYDKGFELKIQWDIPLLDGYPHQFIENKAKNPGTHHFFGIKSAGAIKMVAEFHPTHILVYGWAYYTHLAILRYFHGRIPVLFRGDSTLLQRNSSLKNLVKKPLLKIVYNQISTALFTGTQNRNYFKAYGLADHQLVFAPHAADNQRFGCRNNELQIRQKLQLNKEDILILFAGKLIDIKNPELLTEAFKLLGDPKVHLLLVGDGPLSDKLKTKYSDKNIHFMPFQNQSKMPSVYQACDLFCMPSISESWGMAVNEAMAAGKAILVSDTVGCAVDLVCSKNGRIFQSNNLTDLRQKLRQLIQSRDKLKIMGQSSKAIIQKWNFQTQVKNISSVL
ncbi:MAG TPA: glycosyltransferase family 4 protein [Pedobacter sp.]|nr:glycosyltransferase family 4 protein [Pedobacter sp.]